LIFPCPARNGLLLNLSLMIALALAFCTGRYERAMIPHRQDRRTNNGVTRHESDLCNSPRFQPRLPIDSHCR
jgi:hypothetical protein